jgi:hypothetical protein
MSDASYVLVVVQVSFVINNAVALLFALDANLKKSCDDLRLKGVVVIDPGAYQ